MASVVFTFVTIKFLLILQTQIILLLSETFDMTSKDLNAAMTATTSEHNTSTSSDDSSSDDDSLRSMFPEYYSKQDLNTPFDDVDDDTLNNTASYGSTLLPKSQSMNEQNNIDVSQTSQYEMVSSISNNSTTEQNDQDPGHTIRTLHFQITKRNAKSRNVAIVSLVRNAVVKQFVCSVDNNV